MKVYLQYPWRYSDSPYYKYLITNPPEGIEYLNSQAKGVITSKKEFFLMLKLKSILRRILRIIKIPYITLTGRGDYDLIHCCHCLSLNKSLWVVDVEHYWNFASGSEIAYSDTGKKRIKNFLKKPNCKKILAWSNDCKNTIIENMDDKEIEDKIEVVYPAIIPQNIQQSKDGPTLLFVGRYFYSKGGHHALEVFNRLTKMLPKINCIVVSEVPDKIKQEYEMNKQIKIYNLMEQDKLFELFKKADIFFYPGYSDTFGFALIEAMSFGLPIVTADGFARKEIVTNETGIVIPTGKITWEKEYPTFEDEESLLNDFVMKTASLIKYNSIRKKMGANAFNEIQFGKFSVVERNKKLLRIYRESLK